MGGRTSRWRAKTLVTRREGERRLRNLFDVPEDEKLEVDYMCALHHKILLQGKMYVFENYVCFYSNVFGTQDANHSVW